MRFSSWVWGFCTSIRGGTWPAAVGGAGRGWGSPGARSSALGFAVGAQEPGTPLRTPPGPGAGSALGLAPPKAARGRRGGSAQLPHLPHGPACHTRTLPSAQPPGQLCPPEIITFSLLLLLLLLLQSPSLPCGAPRGISPSPAPLCTLGAPKLRLHSRSHRPRL